MICYSKCLYIVIVITISIKYLLNIFFKLINIKYKYLLTKKLEYQKKKVSCLCNIFFKCLL